MNNLSLDYKWDSSLSENSSFIQRGGPVRLSITSRCNAHCYFCHNEGQKSSDHNDESLITSEIISLINIIVKMGFKKITLTGGDPLLHKNIDVILKELPNHDASKQIISLTTNGINLKKYSPVIEKSNLDRITVSLHSFNREKVRQIMGVDCLAQTIDGIAALVGKKQLVINSVITESNKNEINNFIRFCSSIGATLKVMELMQYKNFLYYDQEYFETNSLEKYLSGLATQTTNLDTNLGVSCPVYEIDGIKVILKDAKSGYFTSMFCRGCKNIDNCGEGIYSLRILSNGLMKPCLFMEKGEYSLIPWLRPSIKTDEVISQILRITQEMVEVQRGKL